MDRYISYIHKGFLGNSEGKESDSSAGDLGLIPGSGRSPGEGNGYPFQYYNIYILFYAYMLFCIYSSPLLPRI